jgi:hypothetical protein
LAAESENYFKYIKQKYFTCINKLTLKKVEKILGKYCCKDTTILLCGSECYKNMIIDAVNNKFTICKW